MKNNKEGNRQGPVAFFVICVYMDMVICKYKKIYFRNKDSY